MKSPLVAISRLHPCQCLALTFTRDDEYGIRRLLVLEQCDNLAIEGWGWNADLKNSTVVVTRLRSVRDLATLARLLEDVEKVAVSGEHGALGLQSSRQRKREEALEALSSAVLTPEFSETLRNEYGVGVSTCLTQQTMDGAWMARFEIVDDNEHIRNIFLDSFSGRWWWYVSGKMVGSDELYTSPAQLQEAIVTAVEAYMNS